MARIYATLIEEGEKTLEDVPSILRNAVIKILIDDGFMPAP